MINVYLCMFQSSMHFSLRLICNFCSGGYELSESWKKLESTVILSLPNLFNCHANKTLSNQIQAVFQVFIIKVLFTYFAGFTDIKTRCQKKKLNRFEKRAALVRDD